MFMRFLPIAALVATAVLASTEADAQAAIMSLNSIGTGGMSHSSCMRRAKDVIEEAGYEYFDTTPEAVWGRTNDNRDMVSIYCARSHDIAVFASSSPTGRGTVTGPLVDRMVEAWQRLRR